MELSNPKRISAAEVDQICANQGINAPTREVGQLVPIEEGDTITLGDVFLTTMGESVANEEGDGWADGIYWVSACKHVHHGVVAPVLTDVADAAFTRGGKKFPEMGDKVTVGHKVEDNLGGRSLYEEILYSVDPTTRRPVFSPALQALNLDLSRREDGRAKLERLYGRTFRVLKRVKAYRLKTRPASASADEWGTKAAHWRPVYLLFFEELTEASPAPAPAPRQRRRSTNSGR